MADNSGLVEFKQGISLLREGHFSEALEYLRRASELKQQNPYYLSFLGVAMARAERKWSAALELCKTAASMRRNEAQLHINLAEVYVSAQRRDEAVATLDRAVQYCGADGRLMRMRAKLGTRSSPVLPFLDRGNALNRGLGKLRHRVFKRAPGSEGSNGISTAGA